MSEIKFRNDDINLDILRKRAFNYRWAEVDDEVIPLTAADPDFKCAPEIRKALENYINDGYFCYTPKLGYESFKKAISIAIEKRKNEKINPNNILPIDSAARGMDIIASAFLKPGDEAIIFDPVDYLFKTSVTYAGAKAIRYPAIIKDGFIDVSNIENYINENTKMICLCNPHNPLGLCYRKKDLLHILQVANKHDLYIMNDEIWSDIVFSDAKFISLLELGNELNRKTITVTGFSKSFCLAGLRIGCVYCTNDEEFNKIVETSKVLTTIGGISSLSQIAGETAMNECYYWVDEFIKYLEGNRDYVYERINKMKGLSCRKPQATYVTFINIEKTGLSADEFVEYMKKTAKIALVPGSDEFFGPMSAGNVRLCFATSREILEEGLNRIEAGLAKL